MQNKIVCTGSSGFIGQHLIKALEGNELLLPKHPIDNDQVKKFKPDIIYNLAAYGQMSNQKEEGEIVLANLIGTFKLLQATKDLPYTKFVQVSTSSILLDHQTMYSATKLGAEAMCQAYIDEHQKPIVVARPYSIYGEGEADFRFIPTVINALIYGDTIELDAEATHDWVYVTDFIKALTSLTSPGFYNLGTGLSTSNLEIVRILEMISGKKLKYVSKKFRSFDNKNWVCPTKSVESNLRDGLLKTFHYYERRYVSN